MINGPSQNTELCNIYLWQSTIVLRRLPALSLSFSNCSINQVSEFFPIAVCTKSLILNETYRKAFCSVQGQNNNVRFFLIAHTLKQKTVCMKHCSPSPGNRRYEFMHHNPKIMHQYGNITDLFIWVKTRLVPTTGLCRRTYLAIFPCTVLFFVITHQNQNPQINHIMLRLTF